jgi:hypothetical protein
MKREMRREVYQNFQQRQLFYTVKKATNIHVPSCYSRLSMVLVPATLKLPDLEPLVAVRLAEKIYWICNKFKRKQQMF